MAAAEPFSLRRRNVLAAGVALAARPRSKQSERPEQVPALCQLAASCGVLFGTMVEASRLHADPAYAAIVARECAVIVPGTEAKWAATERREGEFTYAALDDIARFAAAHDLQLRLHNLVWGVFNPAWVAQAIAEGRGERVMHRHIAAVAGHMRGRGFAWDVVNEPADPRWPSGPEGLCRIGWWHAMGPDYVERAFRLAHEADPQALLFVNDDWLEYAQCEEKRSLYLRLLEGWKRRDVPLHGFGLEAHLHPDIAFDAVPYRRFLQQLASLGLVLHVTELDVQDRALAAGIPERDAKLADTIRHYLDVTLDEPAVKAVLCWGLSDRAGDLDRDPHTSRTDGLASRGTPLDATLRPKPMYHAMAQAFRHAPARG